MSASEQEIGYYLLAAERAAVSVIRASDSVWLRRDRAPEISMYSPDVHVQAELEGSDIA